MSGNYILNKKSNLPTAENESAEAGKIEIRKIRAVMVGMHLTKTRGGISTLTKALLDSSLTKDFDFTYIASQSEDYGIIGKLLLCCAAILRFIFINVFRSPELIYVHLGSNASLYRESLFIIIAKIFRRQTISHFHAGDFDQYYPRQNRAGRFFIRRAISLSDCLIAVSEDSGKTLATLTNAKDRVEIVPNGIETGEFDFTGRTATDEFVRLLFVGAIGKLKGERDLIEALKIIHPKNGLEKIKISFLGYGAETLAPLLKDAGLSEQTEFLGAVSLEERIDFYRQADIFVLPTYGEAMSMSIIEAMAAGLPVVTTDVGGNPELIENGKNGWLVSAGNTEMLAEKIGFFINNKAARRAFGENGRRRAQNEFDIRVCAEKLRVLLRGLKDQK